MNRLLLVAASLAILLSECQPVAAQMVPYGPSAQHSYFPGYGAGSQFAQPPYVHPGAIGAMPQMGMPLTAGPAFMQHDPQLLVTAYGEPLKMGPTADHGKGKGEKGGKVHQKGGLLGGGLLGGHGGGGGFGNCGPGGCGTSGCGDCSGFGTVECCPPRWADVQVDAIFLKRENIGRSNPTFVTGTQDLTASQAEYEYEPGVRFTTAFLLDCSRSLEVTYFGVHHSDGAQFTGNNGTGTILVNNTLFLGAGAGTFFGLSSQLDSVELNHRWRHVNHCRWQTSFFAGARYIRFKEALRLYVTDAGATVFDNYNQVTENDLVGLQVGGDFVYCVTDRLTLMGDLRAGVFGNRAQQNTLFASNSPATNFDETIGNTDIAFAGDCYATAIYKLSHNCSLRAGAGAVYVDGVALVVDNFNGTISPGRQPFVNDSGNALYFGGFGGFEWVY